MALANGGIMVYLRKDVGGQSCRLSSRALTPLTLPCLPIGRPFVLKRAETPVSPQSLPSLGGGGR